MIYMEKNLEMPVNQVLSILQERILKQTTYCGVKTFKNPLDFWIYQEIIVETRPEVIIEIGNFYGGSTLALAHLCDALGHGRVIGLDLSHFSVPAIVKTHPRITLITGDACQSFEQVKQLIKAEEQVLVIEDSSHTFDNSLNVLRTYAPLVKPGGYFIVEDSVCHHGIEMGPKPGPYEAIEAFVNENDQFEIDRSRESFFITCNPTGYLKRRLQPEDRAEPDEISLSSKESDVLINFNELLQPLSDPAKTRVVSNSHPHPPLLGSALKPIFLEAHEVNRSQEEGRPKPKLSMIVILHNMRREAERTLYALSAHYQQEVDEDSYEVIVVENGSSKPLENTDLSRFGRNFKYHYLDNAPKSPVRAINLGASMARGDYLGIIIDGAYLLTPGVIKYTHLAFQLFQNPVVIIRYHFLGPGQQNETIYRGYNQMTEDLLLNHIGWPHDGYRLFEIGEPIAKLGWFGPLMESNCLFVKRAVFNELGGYDEKFDLPAGGYANADFFGRAVTYPGAAAVTILGEAIFHQMHGGATTNVSFAENYRLNLQFLSQYQAIRGQKLIFPDVPMHYLGQMYLQAMLSTSTTENINLLLTELRDKEEEIHRLAAVCAEREALINQLSAICAEREALINQLSAVCAEREALIKSLSAQ